MADVVASLLIKLGLDPSGVEAGAKKAEASVSGMSTKMAKGAGVAIGGVLGWAAKGAVEMENAAARYQAATGASAAEADAWAKRVNAAAGSMDESLREITDTSINVARVFHVAGKELDVLTNGMLDFADATGSNATTSADAAAAALSAWGMEADQLMVILDQATNAQQKHRQTAAEYLSVLKSLSPAFRGLGLDEKEAAAFMNMAADAGADASQMTRALGGAIAKMPPGTTLQTLLDKLQAMPSDTERAKYAVALLGPQLGTKLAAMTQPGTKALTAYVAELGTIEGVTVKAKDAIESTFSVRLITLFHGLESGVRGFGMAFGPAATGLASIVSLGSSLGLKKVFEPFLGPGKAALLAGIKSVWASMTGTVTAAAAAGAAQGAAMVGAQAAAVVAGAPALAAAEMAEWGVAEPIGTTGAIAAGGTMGAAMDGAEAAAIAAGSPAVVGAAVAVQQEAGAAATLAGATAGRSAGRGFLGGLKSMVTNPKVLGGIGLMVGGQLLKGLGDSTGGTLGGLEKVGGSLSTIAGAFMAGGPVLGAVVAIEEAVTTFMNFMDTVAGAQSDLQAKVDAVSQKTGQQALADLGQLTKKLHEVQGWERIAGDTWGGAQEVEGLRNLTKAIVDAKTLSVAEIDAAIAAATAAQVEAVARGNTEIGDEIGGYITDLQGMRGSAVAASDGLWHAVVASTEEGTAAAAAAVETGVTTIWAENKRIREALSAGAQQMSEAWDRFSNAMGKGPKLMSLRKRLEEGRKALLHSGRMLARALRIGDSVGASYWADVNRQVAGGMSTLRIQNEKVMTEAGAQLGRFRARTRRGHRGITRDITAEGRRAARVATKNAEKAAAAVPEALTAEQQATKDAAAAQATAVEQPMTQAAADATGWGSALGANWAAGIRSQTAAAAAAASALAAAAAVPIEAHSPPRKGPLKHIDRWGMALVMTWVRPIHRGRAKADAAGRALAEALYPKGLRWAGHDWLRHLRDAEKAGRHLSDKQQRWLDSFERRRHHFAADYRDRHPGGGGRHGGGSGGWGSDHLRVRRITTEHLDVRGRNGGDIHIHVGALVADDRGLDALQKRMDRRLRLRRRDRHPVPNTTGR